MDETRIVHIVEAALLAAGRPLPLEQLLALFDGQGVSREAVLRALDTLRAALAERALELQEVASGYRIQVRAEFAQTLAPLWAEKPPRYSRALLETLAIIAYRQPITRGEIEAIRGVAVSTPIIKTLLERGWVRIVGHRDAPGKPALFGTTKAFLDHFNLKSLEELPSLAELRDLDSLQAKLELALPEQAPAAAEQKAGHTVAGAVVSRAEPGETAETAETLGAETDGAQDTPAGADPQRLH
ncbi:MAG: hypothetical protein KatS3mg121_0407 [Gammaproteobacteria bacterium]|nr:MAG: hypothetical protein KatS3mg121_0407 [Gammaproteobacteria bacterium]